jgi:adenine C2-methylase RlmN of 23S rRNA A2503 and tRNA A37
MSRTRPFAFALLLTASAVTTAVSAPSLNERKEKIQSMETKVSPEAASRKERSEVVLRAEGVPINKTLPVIETEREVKHRTKERVTVPE